MIASHNLNEIAFQGIGEQQMRNLRYWKAVLDEAMADAERMRPRPLESELDRRAGTGC